MVRLSWRYMDMCQNDSLLTGLLAHIRYIPRCIGYVTEAELFDMPKYFCLAEDVNAARQGAGWQVKGYVTEGLRRGTRQAPFRHLVTGP